MVSSHPQKQRNGQPRFFNTCDAARIAKQVYLDRGVDKGRIVAEVGDRLGFARLVDATQLDDAKLRAEIATALEAIKTIEDLLLLVPLGGVAVRLVLFVIRRASSPLISLVLGIVAFILTKYALPKPGLCSKK